MESVGEHRLRLRFGGQLGGEEFFENLDRASCVSGLRFPIGQRSQRGRRFRTGRNLFRGIELEIAQADKRRIEPSPRLGGLAKRPQSITRTGQGGYLIAPESGIILNFADPLKRLVINGKS